MRPSDPGRPSQHGNPARGEVEAAGEVGSTARRTPRELQRLGLIPAVPISARVRRAYPEQPSRTPDALEPPPCAGSPTRPGSRCRWPSANCGAHSASPSPSLPRPPGPGARPVPSPWTTGPRRLTSIPGRRTPVRSYALDAIELACPACTLVAAPGGTWQHDRSYAFRSRSARALAWCQGSGAGIPPSAGLIGPGVKAP